MARRKSEVNRKKYVYPKLTDSNSEVRTAVRSVRAGLIRLRRITPPYPTG
jgi:hypothetical protein